MPWEILDQMEVASWKSSTEQKVVESNHDDSVMERLNPTAYANPYPSQPRAGRVIRQRRSALAFDGKTSISASFFTMLARVMPRVDRDLCRRPMPWDVLPWDPTVHLALFATASMALLPVRTCWCVILRKWSRSNRRRTNSLRGLHHPVVLTICLCFCSRKAMCGNWLPRSVAVRISPATAHSHWG